MLFARAMTNGAKWYVPGVFGGAPIYTPDELGADMDEEGNIITVEPTVSVSRPPAANGELIEAKRDEFEAVGRFAYGPDWQETARDSMIAFAYANFVTNGGQWKDNIGKVAADKLTYSQLDRAITKMIKKSG